MLRNITTKTKNNVDDSIPAFIKLNSFSDIAYMHVVDITSKKFKVHRELVLKSSN